MKVALIGDVHANLPALEAVLAHAHRQGVEAIWNSGDFLGYGAFPNEVVVRLRAEGALSIIGNYDLKVLKFPKQKEKWGKSKHPQKYLAFQWAYEHLSNENRKYLRSLPEEIQMESGGKNILLIHGSPVSNEEALTPDTPDERLRELAALKTDLIICGHSHQAFARQVDGTWFINPGSVGRPDDGDPRTAYAILQIGPDLLQVEHFRLAYDLDRAVQAIRENGLPEAFAQMAIKGYDLDTVLGSNYEI